MQGHCKSSAIFQSLRPADSDSGHADEMDEYISEKLDKKAKKITKPSEDGPTPALAIKPVKID